MIEDSIAAGCRTCDIARYLGVSNSMVSRLRGFYEVFGTVSPPYPGVQGRPRKIHREAEEGIIDFFEEYPTARQDEVSDFLFDKFDISANQSTVSRAIKGLRLSSKVVERQHAEQDPALHASY